MNKILSEVWLQDGTTRKYEVEFSKVGGEPFTLEVYNHNGNFFLKDGSNAWSDELREALMRYWNVGILKKNGEV
jgi:hypothetical protein